MNSQKNMKKTTVKSRNAQKLLDAVKQSVKKYADILVGRTFLYVFEGRYIEVVFRTKDFLHLTGIQTNLTPKEFFKEALRGTLMPNQIKEFTPSHPYNLCEKKLSQLENLSKLTNTPIFILEDLKTQTFTYKFGLTELNFTLCLSHDVDLEGNMKSSFYIPRSLRVEDSFGRESNAFEVNYIFSKRNDEKKYSVITCNDGKTKVSELPDMIKMMLSDDLLKK